MSAPSCHRCRHVGYMLGYFCQLREEDEALAAEVARLRAVDEPAPAACPLRSEPWASLGQRRG